MQSHARGIGDKPLEIEVLRGFVSGRLGAEAHLHLASTQGFRGERPRCRLRGPMPPLIARLATHRSEPAWWTVKGGRDIVVAHAHRSASHAAGDGVARALRHHSLFVVIARRAAVVRVACFRRLAHHLAAQLATRMFREADEDWVVPLAAAGTAARCGPAGDRPSAILGLLRARGVAGRRCDSALLLQRRDPALDLLLRAQRCGVLCELACGACVGVISWVATLVGLT